MVPSVVNINVVVTGAMCQLSEDPCEPSPCFYGECISLEDGDNFFCDRDTGFTGTYCETPVDACVSAPCYQGRITHS